MTLNEIWFVLFVAIIAGYLILDGFDIGVGILHLFVARTDVERRTLLASIAPVWDGNEVWLILGAGVLFAVFPFAYASLFSGLYVPMMLLLLVIILRTVSMEFRSKMSSAGWRSVWDTVFALASLGLAFMLGMAFGLVVGGLPIDANGDMQTDTLGLITPFAVLVGVTTVAMFSVQGGLYLSMKTDGDLAGRIIRLTPRLMVAFFLLNTLVVIAMVAFQQQVTEVYETDIWPIVFPALALAGVIVAGMSLRAGRHARAFVAWSATIALLLISGAVGLYPNLIVSTIDPAYSITIFNAASSQNTLVVCLIFAVIGVPFVLLYTTGVYYIFRGPVKVESGGY